MCNSLRRSNLKMAVRVQLLVEGTFASRRVEGPECEFGAVIAFRSDLWPAGALITDPLKKVRFYQSPSPDFSPEGTGIWCLEVGCREASWTKAGAWRNVQSGCSTAGRFRSKGCGSTMAPE